MSFFKLFWARFGLYESKRPLFFKKTLNWENHWFSYLHQLIRHWWDTRISNSQRKTDFFFKFWQIIAFLGSKTPVFRQTPKKFVNWIQNQGIRIHSTRVLCCDTEFYSGNQLIIAILVNFGRLGLFWLYLRSQKRFCIIFCFLVLFKHQWIKKKYQTYNQKIKISCHMRDANSTLPCSVS